MQFYKFSFYKYFAQNLKNLELLIQGSSNVIQIAVEKY